MSKALHIPLDRNINNLPDVPYTISFIIRKRQQIDNLNELPKEKRPTDDLIWDGTPEDIDLWIERVFGKNESPNAEFVIDEIEG